MSQLLVNTRRGLYCPAADIYVDPHLPVPKAVITHAHSDHARAGHGSYLAHKDSAPLLKLRFGNINLQTLEYGQVISINGVKLSLHPAGHVIGSAQVRIEYQGQVWVVGGDYKVEYDGITPQFEPVKCDLFITESTFALPIYNWPQQDSVATDVNKWWKQNQQDKVTSILLGYSIGKAQRLLTMLDPTSGPIYLHQTIFDTNNALIKHGYALPQIELFNLAQHRDSLGKAAIIAPPGIINSPWIAELAPYSIGMASGWMQLARMRKGRSISQGFIISDHADWKGLNQAIVATEAETILTTHGYQTQFAHWLTEQGYKSDSISSYIQDFTND